MINRKLISSFIFVSSATLPTLVIAAEEANLTSSLHTRTLAASCAACHGTNGHSVTNNQPGKMALAGMNKDYFSAQMFAFKDGSRPSTVMYRHAKGLHTDEINQLADFFSAQKITPAVSPKPQKLKPHHD